MYDEDEMKKQNLIVEADKTLRLIREAEKIILFKTASKEILVSKYELILEQIEGLKK